MERDQGHNKWCLHAQMMLVYSNVHRGLTAQAKGAAKMIVTVLATQELEAGDLLRRFKAEAAQDESRRGNNNNRYIVVGIVAVNLWKLPLHMGFFSLVFCAFILFYICTRAS